MIIKQRQIKLTPIIISLLIVVAFSVLLLQKNAPQQTPLPPSSPPPPPFALEENQPGRLTLPASPQQDQYVLYDKELSQLLYFDNTTNQKQTIYQGAVDSYALLGETVYIFNKQSPNELIKLNLSTQSSQSIGFSTPLAPINAIAGCSTRGSLLIGGNYSAARRTLSMYEYVPATNEESLLLEQSTATNFDCKGSTAVLFGYADFAGASQIAAINLNNAQVLLETNGDEFSLNHDGSLLAVYKDQVTIYDLISSTSTIIPESNRYHFAWNENQLILVENQRPGIKAFLYQDGEIVPLKTPNQGTITVRNLIRATDHRFTYLSNEGIINQEQFEITNP